MLFICPYYRSYVVNSELAKFLAADERPEESMIYPELYGFLFAVCCAPEMTVPSDWLPMVFNGEEPGYADEAEAEMVLAGIMAVYDEVNNGVISAEPSMPAWFEVLTPPMENFGDEAPLTHWSRGFLIGHDWLSEVWDHYVLNEMEGELAGCLMALTLFSSKELAEAYASESHDEPMAIESLAEMAVDNLDVVMANYAHMGRSIYQALQQQAQMPIEREADKVGRNDACPCGSGKKFKRCCMS